MKHPLIAGRYVLVGDLVGFPNENRFSHEPDERTGKVQRVENDSVYIENWGPVKINKITHHLPAIENKISE